MNNTRSFLVVVLALLCFESFAQILIGPTVSGHIDWVTFKDKEVKDEVKVKPYFGFSAGASISFRVRKKFFLQSSILYSRKGKTLKPNGLDKDFSNETKFNYLEMPILYMAEFKGKLNKKSNREFKWYLGAGPTISYWLGGKGTLRDGDLLEVNVESMDYKITFDKKQEDVKKGEMNVTDANRIQLGLNISAGLIFEPVGFNKIMVAMRYEFGHSFLSRTNDGYFGGYDGQLYYQDELQARTQTLNLALHYFIDLKVDQRNKGKSTIKTKHGKIQKKRR